MRTKAITQSLLLGFLTAFALIFSGGQAKTQCTSSYFISNASCNPIVVYDSSTAAAGDTIIAIDLYWGDGIVSWSLLPSDFPVTHWYASAGTYIYTHVIHTIQGCTDSTSSSVTISSPPIADFTTYPVCLGYPTCFVDLSLLNGGPIIGSWFWDFGDGGTSNLQNPCYTYSAPGTYTVCLTVTNADGCTDTICYPVEVYPNPIADFADSSMCTYDVYFTDLSIANAASLAAWAWSFGDGGTSTLQNPVHTYAGPGTYNACLIITNSNGCFDSICYSVEVTGASLVADFTSDTACAGSPTHFTDLSYSTTPGDTITSWYWDFGDDHTSTLQNPTHIYVLTGNYTVTLSVTTNTGHSHSVQKVAIVNDKAVAVFVDSTCCTYDVFFTDLSYTPSPNSSITGWYWEFGDGASSTAQHPIHTYASYGVYNVTLTVESDVDCENTTTQSIVVPMAPYADFTYHITPSTYFVHFADQSLSGSGDIVSWFWYFGDGTTSTFPDPSHEYEEPGIYTVMLVITTSVGSQDIATKEIELPDISAIDENGNEVPIIAIYPIPAHDHLVVESTEKIDQLRIIDITGNVIKDMQVDNAMIRIPVTGLKNGIYIIDLRSGSNYYKKKFIIHHP